MRKREASTADPCPMVWLLSTVIVLSVLCVPSPPVTTSLTPGPQADLSDSVIVTIPDTAGAIDFGDAFKPADTPVSSTIPGMPPAVPLAQNVPIESLRFSSFTVKKNSVRIALRQNTVRLVAYSAGSVTLHHIRAPLRPQSFRGRLLFEAKQGSSGIAVTTGKNVFTVALPCTLHSDNKYNFIELGDTAYRGTILLTAGKTGTFTVINQLGVEEYLRGVVPLEMGKRSRDEIEALKAQAVAARTYTYKRVSEHDGDVFDLLPTTADQVYGGASVENRESDLAVAATTGLILVYGDSIIMAYYHSTCGGITADVNEAWGRPVRPYLHSIVDTDQMGRAWCRASAYFFWEETWPLKQFTGIVIESLRATFPEKQFRGGVTALKINERFSCGRVRRATISGSGWEQEVEGDQIRFILRRGVGGKPILRSANFSDVTTDRNTIKLSGKGYGHGVGMCQMGAIGRAQSGQNFLTILKSYYTGVSIVTAVSGNMVPKGSP